MPRVTHVQHAQKDYPEHGIKKGEEYYWWKFQFGSKHYSKTPPKPSQLTQSEFLQSFYDLQERIDGLDAETPEDLKVEVDDIASELRNLGEECTGKRDNMPEALQDSETGNMLEERAQSCESAADELENIDYDWDVESAKSEIKAENAGMSEEEVTEELDNRRRERLEEILEEVRAVDLSG